MSSLTTLARPYAKAAFGLAKGDGSNAESLSQWQSMLSLASELTGDERVASALDSPSVSPAQAVDLISGVAGDHFNEGFNSFLSVLGENRRLSLLPEVTVLFQRLKQAAEKSLKVKVVAAIALSEDQLQRMNSALAKRFDCAIELDTEVDGSVLGGAIIYAGDQVIDGSLSGRLNKLNNALSR
jgi:F-type H+-transporting ATPase subunit delta